MSFFDRVVDLFRTKRGLRSEVFLQFKTIYPALTESFSTTCVQFNPLLGLAKRPGIPSPATPDVKQISEIVAGRRGFSFSEEMPDYAYWFVEKSERQQRELFFGHGGMTIFFLKPDPRTVPPKVPFSPGLRAKMPVLQMFDLEGAVARTYSLLDGFQDRSKALFGADLNETSMRGIPFVLPLLTTADFFSSPAEERDKWFQLFDCYVSESPLDRGIIIASATDLDDELIPLLVDMRKEKLTYSER